MTVGDRIKLRRQELEMSQAEVAAAAGYSDKTSVSKLENAGDNISMKQVNRLAKALRCTSSYLMGWEPAVLESVANMGSSLESAVKMGQALSGLQAYQRTDAGFIEAIQKDTEFMDNIKDLFNLSHKYRVEVYKYIAYQKSQEQDSSAEASASSSEA